MNTKVRLVLAFLVSFALHGQSGQQTLTGSCKTGGTYPSCVGGEIVFTGTNYPAAVHVTVTNSSGGVIDDGQYTTNNGVLTFVENLSFADTYAVSVSNQVVLYVTTS